MCKQNERICTDDVPDEGALHLDVDAGQLGDGNSGFVIVRLSRELGVDQSKDLRAYVEKAKLGGLTELLSELGKPPTRRLITSVASGKLLEMEKEAARSPWRPFNSLTHSTGASICETVLSRSKNWRSGSKGLPEWNWPTRK